MAKVKMPRSYPCIDVDTELDYPKPYYVDPLGLEKAVFQYSFIRRRVFKTNHFQFYSRSSISVLIAYHHHYLFHAFNSIVDHHIMGVICLL